MYLQTLHLYRPKWASPMAVGVIHNSNLEVRTVWGLLFCYRSQVMSNHQQPRQTVSYEVGGKIG